MFTIACSSCTAKLKVKNAALIGQVLACPKCGSMIKITALEDSSNLPADASANATGRPNQAAVPRAIAEDPHGLESRDFSEIEQLIREQESKRSQQSQASQPAAEKSEQQLPIPQPRPKKLPTQKPTTSSTTGPSELKRPTPRPTVRPPAAASGSAASVAKPGEQNIQVGKVLPGQPWVSPRAKQRQRMLLLVTIAAVAVLLLGSLIAWLAQPWPPQKPLASNSEENQPAQKSETGPPNSDIDRNPTENDLGQSESGNDSPPPIENGAGNSATSPPAADKHRDEADISVTDSNPPELPPAILPPGDEPPTVENPSAVPTNTPPARPPLMPRQNLVDRLFDEPSVAPQAITETKSPFESLENSDLKNLFQLAGASSEEISDVANRLQDSEFASTACVYIERVEPGTRRTPAEIASSKLVRMSYRDVPASRVLAELSTLANLSMTFVPEDFVAYEVDLGRPVNIDLQNATMLDAFANFAKTFEFDVEVTDWGIVFYHPASRKTESREFRLPQFPDHSAADHEDLVAGIKAMIEPNSWSEESGHQIVLQGDRLTVTHQQRVLRQIARLVDQVTACLSLEQVDFQALPLPLQSPAYRFSQRLNQAIELRAVDAMTLDEFAAAIQQSTGVEFLFDWPELARERWSHQVTVPLYFRPRTIDEALTELRCSMQVTFEFLDDRCVLMTTRSSAWGRRSIEIYPIKDLIRAGVKPETVLTLLHQAVGKNVFNTSDRPITCSYYAKPQAVIVYGPQPIQRQVEAILTRLRNKQ